LELACSPRFVSRGGTLFQSVPPAAVTSASYDLANRLTSRTAAGVTANPAWDKNGNMTSDGVRTYTWDARDRLTGITGVASFGYDASNRRQTATRSGTATSFLYDRWEVAQEQQGGSASADLLLGLGSDERLARGGSTVLTDTLGSTVALASAGAINTRYGYDAFGTSQVTGTASDNTFQFTGRENDGTGLYNYRNRYYNPAWGRFISEDPIGLSGGDVNLYRYVANDPADFRDPTGQFVLQLLGGAAVGGLAAGLSDLGLQLGSIAKCGGSVDWSSVGRNAALGAVVGGLVGVTMNPALLDVAGTGLFTGGGGFLGGLGIGGAGKDCTPPTGPS